MIKSILVVLITLNAFANLNDVEFLECHNSSLNEYNGKYSFDFIYQNQKTKETLDEFISEGRFHNRYLIRNRFLQLGYVGAFNFVPFFSSFTETDYEAAYIWEEVPFGFEKIKIPNKVLPKNCVKKVGETDYVDDVIKFSLKAKAAFYEYDIEKLNTMIKEDGLQFSFLHIHNWLRLFVDDYRDRSRINYLLHLKTINKSQKFELKSLFDKNMKSSPKNDCDRSYFVQEAIKKELKRPCHKFDLKRVKKLSLMDIYRNQITYDKHFLRVGDFNGLKNVEEINAKNIQWLGYTLYDYMFIGLTELKVLDFSSSPIPYIWSNLFKGLSNVEKLILKDTDIEHIGDKSFSGIFSKDKYSHLQIDIHGLDRIQEGAFYGLDMLDSLEINPTFNSNLKENPFKSFKDLKLLKFKLNRSFSDDYKIFTKSAFPKLRELHFIGQGGYDINKINLPTLKVLNMEKSTSGFYINPNSFKGMPALEEVNFSGTFIVVPTQLAAMSHLKNLKTIKLMNLTNNQFTMFDQTIYKLPHSVKEIEICIQSENAKYWDIMTKDFRKKRNVRIKTKNYCKGEWIIYE